MNVLIDKDGKTMTYRTVNNGAIMVKGKRELYLMFKSVAAGEKARKDISKFSFNKLFNTGKNKRKIGKVYMSTIFYDKK
ncbi:MAG: hypothetical protein OEV44_00800 [Spirochaetota bacterium]|nr:hypothetical protein [Spirochaetota bacterium]